MESMLVREAALHERRRQELNELKQQRKEREKTSTSANFSGKQKKQQLRARKQRIQARTEEVARLEQTNDEYEAFYADEQEDGGDNALHGSRPLKNGKKKKGRARGKGPQDPVNTEAATANDRVLVIEDEFMAGAHEEAYHEMPDFFARNHDLSDESLGSDLKLTVALGRHNKDHVGKELSSFFVKETREQIHLRLMEGQQPLNLSARDHPLLASEITRDTLLDHPRRPSWDYRMSKQTVDANESVMFDNWLRAIHDKYDNESLNHFEHNLEVWRELWRVTERATHVVVVTDIRNPLLHIPPSVYDVVTAEMGKPMTVVLNKVDLVPPEVVALWRAYLQKRFPKCEFVCFSSRSQAVQGDNDISLRRRVLTKKLEVGDPSAVRGAVDILCSCGIKREDAQRVTEELNTQVPPASSDVFDWEDLQHALPTEKDKPKRKSRRKQKGGTGSSHPGQGQIPKTMQRGGMHACQHCGAGDAAFACLSCAGSSRLATICSEVDAIAHGYLLCRRCDREEHADLDDHQRFKLTATRLTAQEQSQVNPQNAAKYTVGLIGHPNVGKSSVLNALAGKKLVSVSHTPGHTKRLQSIMITPEICICDCPGLVFPFAGVPKFLQELSGLYPYSQIREPYSAVRFLAEHIDLQRVLDVKPRTQLFDGINEELEWSPWSLCEAYAEKKGYRTDRRGRPDHQRAGAELIRDTVDGIVPLHFLPPNYTGKESFSYVHGRPTISTATRSVDTNAKEGVGGDVDDSGSAGEDNESDSGSDEVDDDDDDNDDVVAPVSSPSQPKKSTAPAAKVNAFSLLDSSSDEEDSDSDA